MLRTNSDPLAKHNCSLKKTGSPHRIQTPVTKFYNLRRYHWSVDSATNPLNDRNISIPSPSTTTKYQSIVSVISGHLIVWSQSSWIDRNSEQIKTRKRKHGLLDNNKWIGTIHILFLHRIGQFLEKKNETNISN